MRKLFVGRRFGLVALVGSFGVVSFAAEKTSATKAHFTFFNPTPADLLRDMSTDRPDQTESPYTVDAGRFQVEMDLLVHTRDHDKENGTNVISRSWSLAPINVKVGVLNRLDLQLVLDPYVREIADDRVARTSTRVSGFGDITTRVKVNLWGNDGGRTALALMPYVKLPLPASDLRNGKTEGGLIVPLVVELSDEWSFGAMTEIDLLSDSNGGRDTEWVNSITLGHKFNSRLGGYCEFFTVTSRAPGFKWRGQIDVGVTYAMSSNLQFDLGCNFGITRPAPDYQPFVGVSRRF